MNITERKEYLILLFRAEKLNVGTVTVSIIGINDYQLSSVMQYYIINPKDISDLDYNMTSRYIYNGIAKTPAVVIQYGDILLLKNDDYTTEYINNTEVGVASVIVKGKGNYTGTKTLTFEIAMAEAQKDYVYLDMTAPTINNLTAKTSGVVVISATIEEPNLESGYPGSGVDETATRYMVSTSNAEPDESDANWQTTNQITTDIKGDAYVWVMAKDKVGNVSKKSLAVSVYLETTLEVNDTSVKRTETVEIPYEYNGDSTNVTVTSNRENIAIIENVDIENRVITIKGVAVGETDITIKIANSESYATVQKTFKVTVLQRDISLTVVFGTNGSTGYVSKANTSVTVQDEVDGNGVDNTSLRYVWSQSAEAPTESAFTESFNNGATISKGATNGIWYLWIYAKDLTGQELTIRSNAFHLDIVAPTGTIDIQAVYEKDSLKYTGVREVDVKFTVQDNIEGAKLEMALINENDMGTLNWITYEDDKVWTLSENEGEKTVFVIFRDEAGNQSAYIL